MFEQKPITTERITAIQSDLIARKDREQGVRNEITELIRAGTPLNSLNAESPVIKKMIRSIRKMWRL